MRSFHLLALVAAVSVAFLSSPLLAQSGGKRAEKLAREFESRKREVLIEAGHRHLELGLWCRDKGLVQQASNEFIAAVEVSENRHPGAQRVLGIMRSLGDDFWKKRRKRTSDKLLAQYDKRSRTAREKGEKERLGLAKWAYGKGLEEGAEEYRLSVARNDAPLEFDRKGRIVLPAGTLPAELSEEIRANAIEINGRPWMRDGFLAALPDVAAIHEAETDRIRVRSQNDLEEAEDVLRACDALLPVLRDDTAGWPQRRMNVFVFADTATYEAYLEHAGLLDRKAAQGLALSGPNVALVNSDGLTPERTTGIALHELSHLFMYGISRSMMPSWYAEGFAETYGGQGCFAWDGADLVTRGRMSDFRLDALTSGEAYIPLREMFGLQAGKLLASDRERGLVFYAQSWAFVRFLREGAGDDVRERFERWEFICRGKALGAVFGQPTERGKSEPAQALFDEMLGDEIGRLEVEFQRYLTGL